MLRQQQAKNMRPRFACVKAAGALRERVGVLLVLLAVFVFWHIAQDVMAAGPLARLDGRAVRWFDANATPLGSQVMRCVAYLHGTVGLAVLCLALAGYWVWIRAWDWLVTLLVTLPSGILLNVLLKNSFQRARPSFENSLSIPLDSYSFPSGHTAAATLFYGVLAACLICRAASWGRRLAIALLALALVALVGLSRVYLGAHYPSDVLAAMMAGGGWLALGLMAAGRWRQRANQGF